MGKSYVESSLKRFLKRKVKVTLGLVVTFLITGTVGFAEINEVPKPEIQYNEFLYYDNEGKKNVSLQGSEEGKTKNYYFNEGATIDASNGGLHSAILSHNWGKYNENTFDIFNIGEGKKFTILQYAGYVNLEAQEGANLKINGGKVILESGANTSNIDNTNAAIHVEDAGKIYIDSESLYIGNKKLEEGKHNVGAISVIGDSNVGDIKLNVVDIKLTENFIAESVDMGIAAQGEYGNTAQVTINTGKDISINASRSDGKASDKYRGAGIYSMAYHNKDGKSKIDLNSQDGNITINAQGYGYYGYGNTETNLIAKNGIISISSSEKQGIYTDGTIENSSTPSDINKINLEAKQIKITADTGSGIQTNNKAVVTLTGQDLVKINSDNYIGIHNLSGSVVNSSAKNIDISGKKWAIYNNASEVNLTGQDLVKINSDNYIGIHNLSGSVVNSSAKNIDISGKKWAIYNDASKVTLTGNDLININSSEGHGIVSTGENADVKLAGNILNLTSSSGASANTKGKINIETTENYITGNLKAATSGEILILSDKNNVTGNILAETEGKVSINFDSESSKLTGYSSLGTNSDGVVNLGLSNNAVWENTDDSEVTDFNLNSGIVKMSHAEKGQDITIKNLTGNNGTFVMDISGNDINHTNKETDFIKIEKADKQQNHFVQLNEKSIENLKDYDFSDKQNGIWFSDSNDNVTFEGKEFSSLSNVFAYTPIIDTDIRDTDISETNGTNWYITGVEEKENEVPQAVIDDISFLYEAAISRLELDTLHKRMGEIRNYENAQGVWFRTSAGELKSDVSDSSFENDYYMLQVGYDKKKVSDKGDWFTGFAVSRRENDIDFRNGDGESENIGLSLYKSFAGKDNTYFDLIGKYTYLDTEYKVHNRNSEMKADYDTWAGTLSVEYGKKYSDRDDKWYVTPHVQLNYTYVNGEDYTTSTDVRVEQDNIDSLIGRVGVYAGKDFEKSSHYLKASVLSEFMGDYGATIKGADASLTKEIDGKDTWTEVGIGGNFQVGNSGTTHIYYDIERTFGSRFETQWQGTLGFRISFDKLSDLFTSPVEAPVTIEAANLFDFDKSEVKPEGKEMIKNASEIMNKKKLKGTLSIEGHTDWTGSEEHNQILSEKRAKAVEEVFKENVTNENIKYETKGYGETKPVADNKTKEGRAANRRVEMKFNK